MGITEGGLHSGYKKSSLPKIVICLTGDCCLVGARPKGNINHIYINCIQNRDGWPWKRMSIEGSVKHSAQGATLPPLKPDETVVLNPLPFLTYVQLNLCSLPEHIVHL